MQYPERYTFSNNTSGFTQNLYDLMVANNDIYWNVVRRTGTGYDNWGTLVFTNKKDPTMTFVMSLYDYHDGNLVRWGLRHYTDPDTAIPDVYTEKGHYYDTPFHAHDGGDKNTHWNWDVITSEEAIVILADPTNTTDVAYPFRAYLGRCKAYENEDPAYANDFVGIFPHMPMNLGDSSQSYYNRYSQFGRGIVRKSRNATEHELYMFNTDSNLRSPGVGGRYFVQPFIVHHHLEGVRGEFWGVHTCVFKDGSQHPDGSILDLGDKKYFVVHVNSNNNYPTDSYGWYYETSHGTHRYWRPYFFGDGFQVYGGGQRALLIEV